MKKIYTLIALGLVSIATTLSAQQLSSALKPHASQAVHSNFKTPFNTNARVSGSGYIDYSWYDINDLSYVFKFNSTYTAIDTSLNYAGVAIYPFFGFTDYSDNVDDFNFSPYPTGLTFTVDSIFMLITHENNSGLNDLLIMELVNLTGTNTLSATATALWADTLVTNTTLSSGGGWLGAGALYNLGFTPGYTTSPGQKIGMVFKYVGDKADTMGVLGSCINDGSGGTMTQAINPTSFMRYPPYINSVSTNRTIGYGSPVGSAGWYEAQDWELWAKISYNDLTGISDNELSATLYQNMPNPSNGKTIIKYDLAKATSVSIQFYDIAGQMVKEINEGEMSPGSYQLSVDISDLSKGSYFYSLKTSTGVSLTKKMLIAK